MPTRRRRLFATTPFEQANFGRRGPSSIDRDALGELRQIVLIGHSEDACFVDAGNAVARMRQSRGEIAIVGQDQEAFGFEIEPPHRIYVLAHTLDQVQHGRTPFRI